MSKTVLPKKSELLDDVEMMLYIRRFEEKAGQLYGAGFIGGFCHLYIGQEAVAVGIQRSLEKTDQVITSYRDHGIMLASGSDPKGVMAELLGKESGCSKGKGGSMHMFDLERGFYGGHGIVGAQVPIGAGMAFANKYKENDSVVVVYFGDGAANQGQIYETFNMANLWQLPVLFVLENNMYGMGTSTERACSNHKNLHLRGESFGIPGKKIDGMDYLEVYKAASDAISKIRSGTGPILLEMETYRYRGHSMSDPGQYRSKEEVSEYKQDDPISKLKDYLVGKKMINEDSFKELDRNVREEVAQVADWAKECNEPPESELYTDIYRD